MGILDDIKSKPPSRPFIIKAKKKMHKGALFGHVSNGGGTMEISEGLALRFTALDDKFIIIEVLDYGKFNKVETQTWQKTKEVAPKAPVLNIKKRDKDGQKRTDVFS